MSNKNYESHRKAIVSKGIPPALLNRLTNSDVQVINTFLTRVSKPGAVHLAACPLLLDKISQ
ncbi:hypothetical protein G998_04260 [Escherichia coli UMEA 3889-1]|nr:hypothetical protein G998_04260 [Escherichia coli UMEA 3889-1]